MLALLPLLILLTVFLVVSRVAAVALEATGMARDAAQFQSRSALMGVGFTTSETEDITTHPLRRRIILFLMTFGNASVITGVASFLITFIGVQTTQTLERSAGLVTGIGALLLMFHTRMANRLIERLTRWALNRYTALDTRDYAALLRFENEFAITELQVRSGEWLADRPLADLHLTREGVVILGIHRDGGEFQGAPTGSSMIHAGDLVLAYGRIGVLKELANRSAATGDAVHERVSAAHQALLDD